MALFGVELEWQLAGFRKKDCWTVITTRHRLAREYQEHGGVKDENTLYVEYDYAGASSGLRPVSLRYPNGRLLHDDELYDYDGVSQLVGRDRGQLSAGRDAVTTKTFAEDWALDATGNWAAFRQDLGGDGTWDLDQTRRHNKVNEATSVSSWATPTHDRAGNMTSMPKPSSPADALATTFDAWNRMVKVEEGEDTVAEYAYTGDNRRAVRKAYSGGVLSETRHFYYTDQWQAIEERTALGNIIAADADTQYVWGPQYVDHLILRDRQTTTSGAVTERLYALRDPNWNVTALVDILGTPLERFTYTAYGAVEVRTPVFQPTIASSLYAWPYTYTTRRLDEETGLMYYRNRMYHPELGRFVSRDPIGYRGGVDLYEYSGDAPLVSTDPSGMLFTEAYERQCLGWAEKQEIGTTLSAPRGTAWLATLPDCPCVLCTELGFMSLWLNPKNPDSSIWYDPQPASKKYHPAATWCMRSRANAQGHGQQCCYSNSGALITDGPGAGTPDYCAPDSAGGLSGHVVEDVDSYNACSAAGMLDIYYKWRPPNNGNECPSLILA